MWFVYLNKTILTHPCLLSTVLNDMPLNIYRFVNPYILCLNILCIYINNPQTAYSLVLLVFESFSFNKWYCDFLEYS